MWITRIEGEMNGKRVTMDAAGGKLMVTVDGVDAMRFSLNAAAEDVAQSIWRATHDGKLDATAGDLYELQSQVDDLLG